MGKQLMLRGCKYPEEASAQRGIVGEIAYISWEIHPTLFLF